MKKAILSGLAVVLLGIIILVVGIIYLQQPTAENYEIPSLPKSIGSEGPYLLATPYPVVNDEYPIYQTVLPVTEKELLRLGNLFDLTMNLNNTAKHNDIIEITDESVKPATRLQFLTNSGTYTYAIPEKLYPYTTDVQPDLPSDEEAGKIASEYLSERNLLQDNVHLEKVTIGSEYGEHTPTSDVIFNLTKDVIFKNEIQGIPVYNANLVVTIGDKGEIVGVSNSFREFDPNPVRSIKVITPEEAYRRLLSGDLVIKPLPAEYDEIIITNITLGYWMEIPLQNQEYIMPVYAFSCVAVRGNEKDQIMRYVSAVDPSVIEDLR